MYKYERGFSLIEVLIALAVVSIAVTAVLHSNSTAINASSRITQHTITSILCHNLVTNIRAGIVRIQRNEKAEGTSELLNQRWQWEARARPSKTRLTTLSITLWPQIEDRNSNSRFHCDRRLSTQYVQR